uniref:Uncharacterized protein n=1 Tax=Oryza nivara TaxID=4536 RepID=A0A0E0GRM7_ORYNI
MASPRQGEGGSSGGGPVGGGGLGIKAEDLLDGGGYNPRGGGSLGTGARFSTMRRQIPSGVEGLGVRVEEDFLNGNGGPRGEDVEKQGCAEVSNQQFFVKATQLKRTSVACPASRPTSSTASGTSSWIGTTCRCPLGTCDLRLHPSPCCAKLYKKGIIQPSPICTHVPAEAEKEGTVAKAEEFGSVGKIVS